MAIKIQFSKIGAAVLAVCAVFLCLLYFLIDSNIVNLINLNNWQLIISIHIIATTILSIGYGILFLFIARQSIKHFKEAENIKAKIITLVQITLFISLSIAVPYFFIVGAAIPSTKDLLANKASNFSGCYVNSYDFNRRYPNQYYAKLFSKGELVREIPEDSEILISKEDYEQMSNGQNCRSEINITYLPNSKIRLDFHFIN